MAEVGQALIDAVDQVPSIDGAGIILVKKDGSQTEIRGGPRKRWVYIIINDRPTPPSAIAEHRMPSFWDRWGSSILSCSAAGGTGVVIYLSGGTASMVVGAFALNSAALGGMSLGEAWEYDAWQEFEENGGNAYKAWLTLETAMALADLLHGSWEAMNFLKEWGEMGKLAKLQKAVEGQNFTRRELANVIKEIDPNVQIDLDAKGVGYFSKSKLAKAGTEILGKNHFKSLSNQQTRLIVTAASDALTIGNAPDTFDKTEKSAELWLIQYDQ
jgi:hypothetical protein